MQGRIKFNKTYYNHPALSAYSGVAVLIQPKKKHLNVYNLNGIRICKAKDDSFTETSTSKQKCLSCPYSVQPLNEKEVNL